MITVPEILAAGFQHKGSYTDNEEKISYAYYEHPDEDLKDLRVEVNYTDDTLSTVESVDVLVPQFILSNYSAERLQHIMSLMRPLDGEIISIFNV